MSAQRSFPEPGVLDPGDQFWLEAMADAVLILSPVYGPRRQVTDFRVDYANQPPPNSLMIRHSVSAPERLSEPGF